MQAARWFPCQSVNHPLIQCTPLLYILIKALGQKPTELLIGRFGRLTIMLTVAMFEMDCTSP